MSILQEGQLPPMIARCAQIPTEFLLLPNFSRHQISEKRLWNWLCSHTLYPHPAVEVAETTTTGNGGMMIKKKNISLIYEEGKL